MDLMVENTEVSVLVGGGSRSLSGRESEVRCKNNPYGQNGVQADYGKKEARQMLKHKEDIQVTNPHETEE